MTPIEKTVNKALESTSDAHDLILDLARYIDELEQENELKRQEIQELQDVIEDRDSEIKNLHTRL